MPLAAVLVLAPLCLGVVANWRYAHGQVVRTVGRGYSACTDAGCLSRWRLPGDRADSTGLVIGAPFEWEEEDVAAGEEIWVAEDGTAYLLDHSPRGQMVIGYGAAGLMAALSAFAWHRRRTG